MAFKMAPKSPALMATGKFGSPAKQTMKSGSSMTAAEKKEMKEKSVFGPDGKNVAKPPKGKSKSKYDKSPAKQRSGGNDRFKDISEKMEPAQGRGMKKELRRIKKEKPSTIEAENVKVEDPKKGIVDTLPKNNGNNKTKKDAKQLTAKQKARRSPAKQMSKLKNNPKG